MQKPIPVSDFPFQRRFRQITERKAEPDTGIGLPIAKKISINLAMERRTRYFYRTFDWKDLHRSASRVALSRRALNSVHGAHVENRLLFGILTRGNSIFHIRQNHE